jgi:hypothetical protein
MAHLACDRVPVMRREHQDNMRSENSARAPRSPTVLCLPFNTVLPTRTSSLFDPLLSLHSIMAQYYSSLFQSGLARESTLPPTAGPSKSASHQASSSATTAATVRDASMRFVFGDNGSLRAHAKSSSADQPRSGGHASFLSMNSSEKRSMVTSATS